MADQQQRTTKITRTSGYHELYSNNCNLRISNWDFFFEFGRVVNITDREVEVNSEVGVYMSPQHAKAFMKVCADHLAQYEKGFGVIATEPK